MGTHTHSYGNPYPYVMGMGLTDMGMGKLSVPEGIPMLFPNGGAAAWVGIDGATCQTALFQTGISFIIQGGQVSYNAWYEWLPDAPFFFYGLDINAGDAIRLTISTDTTTSGTVLIEYLTNGQTLSQPVTSPYALCGQDADWIVEDYESFGTLVPFANFGTVTFTDTTASGGSGSVSPTGAMVVDIQQSGNTLTSTSVDSNGVNVQYV